ncbi:hypothetical protein BD770DRAFT_456724 [Pilaira anomala]|nr:hypothetical protein BD770DRAFT_456724 [Pilaira anomala]
MVHQLNALPFEILKEIFKYLNKPECNPGIKPGASTREDLKNCLLVSRSWHTAAHEFFAHQISITVADFAFNDLLTDIKYFAHKVKSITLDKPCSSASHFYDDGGGGGGDTQKWSQFLEILLACKNLVSVKFLPSNVYGYLDSILHAFKKLPSSIQSFVIVDLDRSNYLTRQLHLKLNMAYHKRITNLTMASSLDISNFRLFENLVQFIGYFPCLASFTLIVHTWDPDEAVIDLNQLFLAAPNLQELKLGHLQAIHCDSLGKNQILDIPEQFTSLDIKTEVMDLNALKYIATRFGNMHQLFLDIGSLWADVSLSDNDTLQLFHDLETITARIKLLDISYINNGVRYHLGNGKEQQLADPNEATYIKFEAFDYGQQAYQRYASSSD